MNYLYDGISFTRESIASYPGQAIGFGATARERKELDVTVSLEREKYVVQNEAGVSDGVRNVLLKAESSQGDSPIQFSAGLRVTADSGKVPPLTAGDST